MNPKISLVVAISKNRAIGKDNKLLFYIPEDLKRFKEITKNHPIIMGRKTFESIGRPLPERTNIIITSDLSYKAEGCTVCHSVEDALSEAKKLTTDEIFVIGGGKIYEQVIPQTDKLYITVIDSVIEEADTFFPEYPEFTKVIREEKKEHNGLNYTFFELEKSTD